MRAFIASLFAAAAFANHEGQEISAIGVGSNKYGLDVWAVTGKLDFESQNIDTWYFGAELTTPIGTEVLSADVTDSDLSKEDTSSSMIRVGVDGNVYQTYVQFVVPNSSEYESFSCSRILSVKSEAKEFQIEQDDGYTKPESFQVTEETIGSAQVQNYYGERLLSEVSPNNNNDYSNQLIEAGSGVSRANN